MGIPLSMYKYKVVACGNGVFLTVAGRKLMLVFVLIFYNNLESYSKSDYFCDFSYNLSTYGDAKVIIFVFRP